MKRKQVQKFEIVLEVEILRDTACSATILWMWGYGFICCGCAGSWQLLMVTYNRNCHVTSTEKTGKLASKIT